MKKIILFLYVSIVQISFGQLPKEFPAKWRNKVICGNASTTGKMIGGSTAFLDFPFKLTISDKGIFAEYNLDEKFGRNNWGTTQTVTSYEVYEKKPNYDRYNDLYGYVYKYKVPNIYRNSLGEISSDHSITEIILDVYIDDPSKNILTIKLASGTYNSTSISSNNTKIEICETILSDEELKEKEERERVFANQNNENDKLTIVKVNDYLKEGNVIEAAREYSKLNTGDMEIKRAIQEKLDLYFVNDSVSAQLSTFKEIIKKSEIAISKLNVGEHKYKIEKNGDFYIDGNKVAVLADYLVEEKSYGKFKTKIASFGSFNLSITEKMVSLNGLTDIYDNSVRLVIPSDKKDKVLYEKNGKFYFGKFGSPLSATYLGNYELNKSEKEIKRCKENNLVLNPIELDSTLTDKILIQPLFLVSVHITLFDSKMSEKLNEIVLSESETYKTTKEVLFQKGTGRKIFRSVTAPIWFPFWAYYNYYMY